MSRTNFEENRRKTWYFCAPGVTQLDLMSYLKLCKTKKPIEVTPCSVKILGSKCSICKREFKCITDTQKHMQKKHKYLKRKSDDKLVRIKLKLGSRTFCDNKICKKYLQTPKWDERFQIPEWDKRLQTPEWDERLTPEWDGRLETPEYDERLRTPEYQSLQTTQYSRLQTPELQTDSEDTNSIISSKCRASTTLFAYNMPMNDADLEAKLSIPEVFTELNKLRQNQNIAKEQDSSSENDKTWGSNSPAASDSDSNTIVYVSDVEMDLSELYEDIKQEVPEIIDLSDSEVEDGETVIGGTNSQAAKLDTSLADLEIDLQEIEELAAGSGCEDLCADTEDFRRTLLSADPTGFREVPKVARRSSKGFSADSTDFGAGSKSYKHYSDSFKESFAVGNKGLREDTKAYPVGDTSFRENAKAYPAGDTSFREDANAYPAADTSFREDANAYLAADTSFREGAKAYPAGDTRFKEYEKAYPAGNTGLREDTKACPKGVADCRKGSTPIPKDLEALEDTFSLNVDDIIDLDGLEEGDQDVLLIEDNQPQLVDFLEAAVLHYVEKCKMGPIFFGKNKENEATNFKNITNHQMKNSSIFNHPLKNSSMLDDFRKMPLFNFHFKKALEKLGINTTPPPLIDTKVE